MQSKNLCHYLVEYNSILNRRCQGVDRSKSESLCAASPQGEAVAEWRLMRCDIHILHAKLNNIICTFHLIRQPS